MNKKGVLSALATNIVYKYCCHIWAGAPASCLDLLDKIQKRVVNLVGPILSSSLQPLSHRRDVASLSLFYRYYHDKCSSELQGLVPSSWLPVRSTRFSKKSHPLVLWCLGSSITSMLIVSFPVLLNCGILCLLTVFLLPIILVSLSQM